LIAHAWMIGSIELVAEFARAAHLCDAAADTGAAVRVCLSNDHCPGTLLGRPWEVQRCAPLIAWHDHRADAVPCRELDAGRAKATSPAHST